MSTRTNAAPAQVLALLMDETALQEQHVELLKEQKQSLISCDREEFALLQQRHEALVKELERQGKRRANAIPCGAQTLMAAATRWKRDQQDQLAELLNRLRDLLGEVKQQSAQNRVLIGNEVALIDFQLDLMIAAARKGTQYVNTGEAIAVQANRLINQTA